MASNSNNSSSVFTCYKAKYNNISKQNKEYYSYIFLISLTLSLPECLMEFCKVTLTFESARKAKEELFMQFESGRKNSFLSLFHASDMRNIISFPFELMNSNETTEHDSLFKT